MLERAKEVTRNGRYTYLEYARWADDLVILVDGCRCRDWLYRNLGLHSDYQIRYVQGSKALPVC